MWLLLGLQPPLKLPLGTGVALVVDKPFGLDLVAPGLLSTTTAIDFKVGFAAVSTLASGFTKLSFSRLRVRDRLPSVPGIRGLDGGSSSDP